MEKEVFERFMQLRFPFVDVGHYYYNEWKNRFSNNPIVYMDYESMEKFKQVLNELYIKPINKQIKNK